MSDYLSDDTLVEIFARATAETLVRCTLVCKRWNSIITNPIFIKTHLNHQKTRDHLIVRTFPEGSQEELYSWHCDNLEFTMCGLETPINRASGLCYRIVGSCNGILCLSDDGTEDIFLWNPAIRKWLKLPPHPFLNRDDLYWLMIGFAFDIRSDDYKVLVIIPSYMFSDIPPEVCIYSLNSDNWKDISHLAKGFEHLTLGNNIEAFANGATHFIANDRRIRQNMVFSFHISDEQFDHFESPAGINFSRLFVLEGLLCLVEDNDIRVNNYCIWRMEEYGVVSSWTKFLKLDFSGTLAFFKGVRKNSEVLVEVEQNLCSYDPTNEGDAADWIYELGISSGNPILGLRVEPFVESLVLFGRQNRY